MNRATTAAQKFRAYVRSVLRRKKPLSVAPDVDNKTFLFIGGAHRSGTSILHRLLREHPDTSGFVETGARQDEGQHLQTVYPAADRYGGPGRFAFDADAHLTESSDLVSAANRQKLLREWGAYYDLDAEVLLEKSPANVIRSRFLQALLPNSRFVFIVRHPVAVSLATQKWSKSPLDELMRHWLRLHEILLSDLALLNNSLVLRYEDLVESPDFWLRKICSLANLDPLIPQELLKNINQKYLSKWQSDHESDLELISERHPEIVACAAKFGYSFNQPFVFEAKAWIASVNGA